MSEASVLECGAAAIPTVTPTSSSPSNAPSRHPPHALIDMTTSPGMGDDSYAVLHTRASSRVAASAPSAPVNARTWIFTPPACLPHCPYRDRVNIHLAVTGLTKTYGGRRVVADTSFEVRGGEVVALVGENGAGKTTLLRCVLGTETPDAGSVTLDGEPLDDNDPLTRRRVAAVLDDMAWYPDLTAWEHLDLLARAHGDDEDQEIVDRALAAVRLSHVADQMPGTLSSGQRRRLGLATTLVRPFDVVLLDEPEQRLDEAGRAVLMASHDAEVVARCGARIVHVEAPDEVSPA